MNQSGSIKIIPLRGPEVDDHWSTVGPMLQRALDHSCGELDIVDVFLRIKKGLMQLLIAQEDGVVLAAFVTEVVQYPQRKALKVVLGGGAEMEKWTGPLREMLIAGARNVGADMLEMLGRKGWAKALASYPTITMKYYTFVEDLR